MAKRYRVIAHGMHETELLAAARILPKATITASFVTGEAEEADIAKLESEGLIVQKLAELDDKGRPRQARPETPGLGTTVMGTLRPNVFSTSMVRASDQVDLTRPNVFLIQLNGPVLDEWRRLLDGVGATLLEAYQDNFYSAFLTSAQVSQVRQLDFVAQVMLYDGQQTAPGGAASGQKPLATAAAQFGARPVKIFDVRLHRAEDLGTVQAWLKQQNVAIAGATGRKIRIHILEASPILGQLASLPEVQSFEEFVAPKLFNDRARAILQIDPPGGAAIPYDGQGQIVGVADTGLDDAHPDFAGRILKLIAKGRPTTDDPHGHGTHVAGSVLGSGQASGGTYKGTAPAAKLVLQSLLDSQGGLGGLPLNLGDLFDEAYQEGARIHSNSWGAGTISTYTMNSLEVDEFVAQKRDMLIVAAAGNEGQAADRRNTPTGVVDWLSIGSPATAKNALTVGASRSDRTSGGYSMYRWGQAWSNDFPDPPIATDTVSGNPECMAAFSSRGPSDDRRIKPDVVAPGTDIISTRSSRAPIGNFWGPVAGSADYGYMGGTSMATPLVSGCAALVRQYYVRDRKHDPSAALLRGTLINGTRWLNGVDANASNPSGATPAGNYDQGFGRINMTTTLPNPTDPNFSLDFIDNWNDPAEQLASTGDRRRYTIQVNGGTMLRICLAYADAPARGLQNNVNLFVQEPGGQKFVGNFQLRQSLNIPDGDNNVEVLRIPNPQPGPYLIQIAATNLLHPPQDFALVVAGQIGTSKLQKI